MFYLTIGEIHSLHHPVSCIYFNSSFAAVKCWL